MNLLTTAPRNDFLLSKEVQGMAGNGVCWGKIKAGLQGVSSTVQALTTSLFKRNNSMATEILGASDAPAGYGKFKCAACGREGMAAPSARARVYCNATCSNRFASEKGKAESRVRKQAYRAMKPFVPAPHSKTCTKCCEAKDISEFSKDARVGYKAACKTCKNAQAFAYAEQNKDKKAANWLSRKADPESHGRKLAQGKMARDAANGLVYGWNVRVPLYDAHIKTQEAYFATRYNAHVFAWAAEVTAATMPAALHDAQVKAFKRAKAEYRTWRWLNDPTYSLYSRIRGGIHTHVQHKSPARIWRRRLGYTMHELLIHIERQFTKGMSWENKDKWHLDHIVAASTFDIDSVYSPEFKACFGLHNLRPLWATENIKKGARREFLL